MKFYEDITETSSGGETKDQKLVVFDLSDHNVIFDDENYSLQDLEPYSSDPKDRNMSNDPSKSGDNDLNESYEDDTLDGLTYYPRLRRSSRRTTGAPPNRLGYDTACVVVDPQAEESGIPKSYEDAVSRTDGDKWIEALKFEFKSLNDLGTWELVELPPRRKVIKTKWVFDIKFNGKGDIERYKTRLVAKGFSQIQGVDFHEVFSQVSRYTKIRLMFSLADIFKWKRILIDVKNAIVNAPLKKEIYVNQPTGFEKEGKEDYVYLLKKALYGLRQA